MSDDPETTSRPFKDYRALQVEMVKLFTEVPALNAHIDEHWNLVITTFSKADDENVKSIKITDGAFNNAKLERIVQTHILFGDQKRRHRYRLGLYAVQRDPQKGVRYHRNQTHDPKKHRH